MTEPQELPRALTPDDPRPLRSKKIPGVAAGIQAAVQTARHGVGKMGLVRTLRTLTSVNQVGGFDCPGCAWPDPDPEHRTAFEFCENGAKAVADEAMKRKVDAAFFARHSVAELAERTDYWLNKQGRLVEPVVLEEGASHYTPISWDAALGRVAEHVSQLNSPSEAAFYTSGRTSNEAAFLWQLLARAFGTNNLPDCSNMCHESSGHALGRSIGIGKGTVTLEDFEKAELILVIGQNPGTNHPRMLTALRDARKGGARIVSVNPIEEVGLKRFKHPQEYMRLSLRSTELAELHLPVILGGDLALFMGVAKGWFANHSSTLDNEFIKESTNGFDEFRASVESTPWDDIVAGCGISKEEIISFAEMIATSKSVIFCWAMGLTQHIHAVDTIRMVANIALMGGHIGREGAGLCPVRGHSNVQGDRTVGIWERPSEAFLDRLDSGIGFQSPREHGVDVVHAIEAMRSNEIKVLLCMGGNLLSAAPDTERTAEGLRNCNLTLQVSTKLNRSHLVTGREAIIFPCLGRTERDLQGDGDPQFVTVENSMGVVHTSVGKMKPASTHLRSEPWIVGHLAERILGKEPVDWTHLTDDYDRIRDLIEASIAGFDDYNLRVRQRGGFALPNPPRDSRSFNTSNGKANFHATSIPELSLQDGELAMMTIRSHDQYNTTIYGLNDRYRGIHRARRIVLMNSSDMSSRGLDKGQKVTLVNRHGGVERRAESFIVVPYDLPPGCAATYFPEANSLVPLESTAIDSNTPTSKRVVITIE